MSAPRTITNALLLAALALCACDDEADPVTGKKGGGKAGSSGAGAGKGGASTGAGAGGTAGAGGGAKAGQGGAAGQGGSAVGLVDEDGVCILPALVPMPPPASPVPKPTITPCTLPVALEGAPEMSIVVGEQAGARSLFALHRLPAELTTTEIVRYTIPETGACSPVVAEKLAPIGKCDRLKADSSGAIWCSGDDGVARVWPTKGPRCSLTAFAGQSTAIDAGTKIISTYLNPQSRWSYDDVGGCKLLEEKPCKLPVTDVKLQYDATHDAKGFVHAIDLGGNVIIRDGVGYVRGYYEGVRDPDSLVEITPCGDGACAFELRADRYALVSHGSGGEIRTELTSDLPYEGALPPGDVFASRGAVFASRGPVGFIWAGAATGPSSDKAYLYRVTGF